MSAEPVIHNVLSSKRVESNFWVNYPFKGAGLKYFLYSGYPFS